VKAVYTFLAAALVLSAAAPANAQDAGPAAPAAKNDASRAEAQQALEQTIAEQKSRRSGAIAGFVVGGLLILGGLVVTIVQTAHEVDRKEQRGDNSDTPLNWTGTLCGIALAAPVIWLSVDTFTEAQRKFRDAKRHRVRVGLIPERKGAALGLSLAFGGSQ
jgi:hypothetical protein